MQTQMFNQISPVYDRVNRLISFGLDRRWRRSLLHHLPSKPNLHLLDVATGTGDEIMALKHAFIEKAVGVDLADEMLQIARQKLPNCNFLYADAVDLPFSEDSFDVCTICFGIRNIDNPPAALKEMHRVLKKNGRCLILEFSVPSGWIRPFYLFYLRHLIPKIGGFFSNYPSAYRHLSQSIESFAQPSQMIKWMQDTGFYGVETNPLCFGTVILYRGEK
jgi:demethylmenaquinone methyltransferase / 2-methoxy-6-polyprenyl-1,4-benzoquinol methylase